MGAKATGICGVFARNPLDCPYNLKKARSFFLALGLQIRPRSGIVSTAGHTMRVDVYVKQTARSSLQFSRFHNTSRSNRT